MKVKSKRKHSGHVEFNLDERGALNGIVDLVFNGVHEDLDWSDDDLDSDSCRQLREYYRNPTKECMNVIRDTFENECYLSYKVASKVQINEDISFDCFKGGTGLAKSILEALRTDGTRLKVVGKTWANPYSIYLDTKISL